MSRSRKSDHLGQIMRIDLTLSFSRIRCVRYNFEYKSTHLFEDKPVVAVH